MRAIAAEIGFYLFRFEPGSSIESLLPCRQRPRPNVI